LVTVVIDTNVLISALVGHGKPRQLVLRLLQEHTVVSSTGMLAELADVLTRVKFAEIKSSQINYFLTIVARKSVLVEVKQPFKIVAEDPDDDMVLATAHQGKARYVVSGDTHLLRMKEFRGIKMVTVKRMIEVLDRLKD
jgi:putative PIN family toxin of toxin-antitoxin system